MMACLGLLAGLSGGCHSSDPPRHDLKPTYDTTSGRLRELSYDSNSDGHADMKAFMDGSRVLKVEVDENLDGRPDRWEYYGPPDADAPSGDAAGRFPAPIRVEFATRHDGKVTRKEGFEAGRLAWVEEDRDGDGRIDRWETYVDGALSTLALDTEGRGTPNRQITYVGDTVRIEEK